MGDTYGETLRHEFSYYVSGSEPFKFIWYRDGVKIAESTVPSITITSVTGVYSVEVINKYGRLTIILGEVHY